MKIRSLSLHSECVKFECLTIPFQPSGGCLQEMLDEDGEVLLDPNTWSEDGTISLAHMKFSEDAAYLAYGQSASGSDWITIKVMRVADRVVQSDTLSWVRFYCSLCTWLISLSSVRSDQSIACFYSALLETVRSTSLT